MPNKMRLILDTPEGPVKGTKAVGTLCRIVGKKVFGMKLPVNWTDMKTQMKLELLAKYLPAGYSLTIFREPKWTRKDRSKYAKTFKESVANFQLMNKNPKEPMYRLVGNEPAPAEVIHGLNWGPIAVDEAPPQPPEPANPMNDPIIREAVAAERARLRAEVEQRAQQRRIVAQRLMNRRRDEE